MTNIGAGRPLRVCDLCGGVDDHPRHVIAGTEAGAAITAPPSDAILAAVIDAAPPAERTRLVRDLLDTGTSERHLDCCAQAGCPLPADDPASCPARTAGAPGTGAALLAYLED